MLIQTRKLAHTYTHIFSPATLLDTSPPPKLLSHLVKSTVKRTHLQALQALPRSDTPIAEHLASTPLA